MNDTGRSTGALGALGAGNSTRVRTNYGLARAFLAVFDLFGWILVIVGAIGLFLSLSSLMEAMQSGNASLAILGVAPSVGILVAGMFMIANGQLVTATLDGADCARESLFLARKRDAATS